MDNFRTITALLPLLVVSSFLSHAIAQQRGLCEEGSCYPQTGNLLIGREKNLSATSTCGMRRPDRYCVVSYLEKDTKCFTCDSRRPVDQSQESHRIENVVSSFNSDGRWWQAETGKEEVSIQLDLEAEFHFTHMIMTFKTFRPKAMLIERSYDFGKTWKVYRYYAERCRTSFPHVRKTFVTDLSDVICDETYSSETPSTNGEVIFRVRPPHVQIRNPFSEEVQDLLKITNLRINFTELHTLGDTLLDSRPEIKEKYYYAVNDIVVRGSCSCYGHASECLPADGSSGETPKNMVHGKCKCTHNTQGLNCEECLDFYHDHPWKPAGRRATNECKRCNCNNHATKCHFDAARYQQSNQVSGGVCDDCRHNTMGVNCQECEDFYYQDPDLDIRDPRICRSCDCDPIGSLNKGMCEKVTDPSLGTVAGRCNCKNHVEGPRCDRCETNYWNLGENGCQPCVCNPDGIIGTSSGCDMDTGTCNCKRYVAHPNCDRCLPGYYGLSRDNIEGCKHCNCDLGGALSSSCDDASGQCRCRPHITGQRCKKVEPGYFLPHLDYYLFEAESAKIYGRAKVRVRTPYYSRRDINYWTGPGDMAVYEGDSLEFTVSGLPFDTYYDIVIRFQRPICQEMGVRLTIFRPGQVLDVFEDVRVTVIRPEKINAFGLCGDVQSNDDFKNASLGTNSRGYAVVDRPACFERDTTYTIRLDFIAYQTGAKNPRPMFIDSIVLVPATEYIPIYQAPGDPTYLKQIYINERCNVAHLPSVQYELSEKCKESIFSISSVLHNGALACDCDVTGSTSVECEPLGGQCSCKPNVIGRQCDICQIGFYGHGPEGCIACNCHNTGSSDNFCNDETGKCTCIANVVGRTCDRCKEGYWGFPQCRPCRCNENADTCDPETGECINCKFNTSGTYCDRCEDGYYGDPRKGRYIACKPCMCPGGPGSSVQHADTCRLDRYAVGSICNCQQGYTGSKCDKCIENYFGSPTEPGGVCEPCFCNNNVDPNVRGNCDASTGQCLNCLYNTEGFACEHCLSGYYGDATKQNCKECVCYSLGTDSSKGECNRVDGQCPCLPGVIGQRCDQCEVNYWNLASQDGCSPCDCDPIGSESLQCNLITGQCPCVPGRGGLKCADCEDGYYGDPNIQCIPCDCHDQGSVSRQCDRRGGQCDCVEGVTGFKCDSCARGTTGILPNCLPCGECFDNWDTIIMELRDSTHDIVRRANQVSVTGAIKAFDEEFRLMQANIDEIKMILGGVNTTQVDIRDINEQIDMISMNLTKHTHKLIDVEKELRNSSARVKRGDLRVGVLQRKVADLKTLAMELKDNATEIQIREAKGAYDRVREAKQESDEAQYKVDGTSNNLRRSEAVRQRTEQMLKDREDAFNDAIKRNQDKLDSIETGLNKLDMDMSDINGLVCGDAGSPCSSQCGGGGCGKCGGPSCNGATTLADKALTLTKEAEELLNAKTKNASEVLVPQIKAAHEEAMEAHQAAQAAHEAANKVHNQTESTNSDLKNLLDKIREFIIGNNTNSPDDVEKVVNEVLNMSIPLSPEKIQELADKIGNALASLTDIDKILNDTAEKREIAENLKEQAKDASDGAQDIRETAQLVRNALEEAKKVQEKARKAIEQAKTDIQDAEDAFKQIKNNTDSVNKVSAQSQTMLDSLKKKLEDLNNRYDKLQLDVLKEAEDLSKAAHGQAEEAYQKALDLNATYADTSEELDNKHNETEKARELSKRLKERADAIFTQTETQKGDLKEIENKLSQDETRLSKLSDEIDKLNMKMDEYLSEIRADAKYYETC